ncbi:MAG: hypothetical protein ILO68_01615 [Clostridia bacterium]|nr:hypothetical protein [Clostridia bacterium]
MEKRILVERSKMYLQSFLDGIHPVTGERLEQETVWSDEKVRNCFRFLLETLDEYLLLTDSVRKLEQGGQKRRFAVSEEQRRRIRVHDIPVSARVLSQEINAVIDKNTTETMTEAKLNAWLVARGLADASKVHASVHRTVYKPTDAAREFGFLEDRKIDPITGELQSQIRFDGRAQAFIVDRLDDIASFLETK